MIYGLFQRWIRRTAVVVIILGFTSTVDADTFTVDRTDDPDPNSIGACEDAVASDCSLRKAIIVALASPNPPHVVSVPDGTFNLTRTGSDNPEDGDLDITGELTIQGTGSELTIIDASTSGDRIFHVLSTATDVEINDLTMQGASSNGFGAGLRNEGALTLNRVVIDDNRSTQTGGGIFNFGPSADLTINNSTISNNNAGVAAGIAVLASATLVLNDSFVTGNSNGSSPIGGAGLLNLDGNSTLINTLVSGNDAGPGPGGGISNSDTLILTDSTIRDNAAAEGGGISQSAGTITMTGSLISGNDARTGSAIHQEAGAFNIENSTISGNINAANPIHLEAGTLDLLHVTLADNISVLNNVFGGSGGSVMLERSLVGGKCAGSVGYFTAAGNVESPGDTCDFGIDDKVNQPDLLLRPLGPYGGATLSMLPQLASPALDYDPLTRCPPPGLDQRGFVRPVGAGCDSGSVEHQADAEPPILKDGFESGLLLGRFSR